MKVIFLDIDGVISTQRVDWKYFDPECLFYLKHILTETDAKIVISSSWRHGFIDWAKSEIVEADQSLNKIRDMFRANGLSPELVIDVTPTTGKRGNEIALWLEKHPETEAFVILDDESEMNPYSDRLVQTHPIEGLSREKADKAIEMLLVTKEKN